MARGQADVAPVAASDASGARAVARCDLLGVAPYSDGEAGLFRAYLTPAHVAAQRALAGWMREAGMTVRIDAAANVVGRYEGRAPAAPALLIGSHIDSVRDAGRYDGPLGVMLGIECVAALAAAGRRLPFAIEVVAFGDEEGSRFPAAMLASRAVAGTLDPALLAIADAGGLSLSDALAAQGLAIDRFTSARRERHEVIAYLEAHIEQGPVLEARGLPVGSVTGIAAQARYECAVTGHAGHAGTTVMGLRRDALAGAAAMIVAIERIATEAGGDLVATVGRIAVAPGSTNVVPGRATFAIDLRAGEDARRDEAGAQIVAELEVIATARGVAIAIDRVHALPASPCDPALIAMIDAAIAAEGTAPLRLVSGAGHDAMTMAALCPTAMLFVRCRGGISHHPAEHVEPADAEVALAVMLGFIDRLAARSGA